MHEPHTPLRYVIKRPKDGATRREPFMVGKIQKRITDLVARMTGDTSGIEVADLVQEIVHGVCNDMKTCDIDVFAANCASGRIAQDPGYKYLAAIILADNLHKNTRETRSMGAYARALYSYKKHGTDPNPLLSKETYDIMVTYSDELDEMIVHERDFTFDFFGFMTLYGKYLIRMDDVVAETPQQLFMRVAIGIHKDDLDSVKRSYDLLSTFKVMHATPTLFNAGTPRPQLASCFLLTMEDDSIDGIYSTLQRCAKISKHAGGIGLTAHKIRACGSYIRGTNGISNGLSQMLKVFNESARYVDQGGGKRKGSFAIYLSPWHADIKEFLSLKRPDTAPEFAAHDLFYAMWISDLFMERVRDNGTWSLFCPDDLKTFERGPEGRGRKPLQELVGDDFKEAYCLYEQIPHLVRKRMAARELFEEIVTTQRETGTPYVLFKDHCNKKSNQQHLGTILSSNLCAEIIEYSSPKETAVCNLGSMVLPNFVDEDSLSFNFPAFMDAVRFMVRSLDRVISATMYAGETVDRDGRVQHEHLDTIRDALRDVMSSDEVSRLSDDQVRAFGARLRIASDTNTMRRSNERHRPIGLGIQGLADVFKKMRYPYDSKRALRLDRDIMAAMYYAALTESCKLADELGAHASFAGSPMSKGLMQPDLWSKNGTPVKLPASVGRHDFAVTFDWDALRTRASRGVRNSLLIALMPTASTSQITGSTEAFHPLYNNMFERGVLGGTFTVVNEYLVKDLKKNNLWREDIRQLIMMARGSVSMKSFRNVVSKLKADKRETFLDSIPDSTLYNVLDKLIPSNIRKLHKTTWEIKPEFVINHAIVRGPFVCQSQSMNLFINSVRRSDIFNCLMLGWKGGLKTGSYYIRSRTAADSVQFTVNGMRCLRSIFPFHKAPKTTRLTTEQIAARLKEIDHVNVERIIRDRISDSENRAVIVTKDGCTYCERASKLLKTRFPGSRISFVDATSWRSETRDVFFGMRGAGRMERTFPQIWIDGEYIGGHSELRAFIRAQEPDVRNVIKYEEGKREEVRGTILDSDEEENANGDQHGEIVAVSHQLDIEPAPDCVNCSG